MRYRNPERVAAVVEPPGAEDETSVYLCRIPDGAPVRLRGLAALIWVLAADGEQDVTGALTELLGEPPQHIGDQVDEFLTDLVRAGWLVES